MVTLVKSGDELSLYKPPPWPTPELTVELLPPVAVLPENRLLEIQQPVKKPFLQVHGNIYYSLFYWEVHHLAVIYLVNKHIPIGRCLTDRNSHAYNSNAIIYPG